MTNNIIETFDLTKIYKLKSKGTEIKALDNINLSVKEGEIFGLLGPNGAGKTTLIHIFTTIKQPTSGYATINGVNIIKNPKLAKRNIALMLENKMLYYRISGYDNLKFFSRIYKVHNYKEKINKLAKEFGLEDWLSQYVENYSSGMKMKLALLRTLLLERNIMFLDEPTLGIDVKTVSFLVNKLRETKKTIFLTSHDMSVVEKLCDRVAFINKGNILKVGTIKELNQYLSSKIKVEIDIIENKNQMKSELNSQNYITEIRDTGNGYIIKFKDREHYKELFQLLSKYNVLKMKELEMSLEELFLKII